MARRVVRARSSFRGASRRPGGSWGRTVTIGNGLAAATKLLVATFVLDNDGIAETIRRTVGHLSISSDQEAALETPIAAVGMIVVSDAAAAIGVTAIPGPLTDESDDGWFVWQSAVITQGANTSRESRVFPFDSRGMRRVEQGFQIAVVLETGATFGSILQLSLSSYATRS